MSFTLKLLPSAISDIQQAYDWYEEQSEGLGERFFDTVEHCLSDLTKYPFYQVRYNEVRCLPIPVFPYMLHFTVDENLQIIFVSSILHTKKSNKSRLK